MDAARRSAAGDGGALSSYVLVRALFVMAFVALLVAALHFGLGSSLGALAYVALLVPLALGVGFFIAMSLSHLLTRWVMFPRRPFPLEATPDQATNDRGEEPGERLRAVSVSPEQDAVAAVDSVALARLLASSLAGPLGPEFDVVASPHGDCIQLSHGERTGIALLPIQRFRLDTPEEAVAACTRQALYGVQQFATRALGRPWPTSSDPMRALVQPGIPRLKVTTSDGLVTGSWRDELGIVLALDPFPLDAVLPTPGDDDPHTSDGPTREGRYEAPGGR